MAVGYTKWQSDGWKDLPDRSTPIDASGLDHIEAGIADAHDALAQLPSIYVPRLSTISGTPNHTTTPAYIDDTVTPPVLMGWNGTAYAAIGGGSGSGGLTVVDNGDGTGTFTPSGSTAVTDNGDGTGTIAA